MSDILRRHLRRLARVRGVRTAAEDHGANFHPSPPLFPPLLTLTTP